MNKQSAIDRFINLTDGRIFRIVELSVCVPAPNRRVRYRCHLECAQHSEPRDDFDFDIYLYHELFARLGAADHESVAAAIAAAQVAVWLERNRCRVRWSTGTVEIHFDGRPPEVFIP